MNANRAICGLFAVLLLSSTAAIQAAATNLRFEVSVKAGLVSTPQTGRLLLVLTRKNLPEPRLTLGETGPGAPVVLGTDANDLAPGAATVLDAQATSFPVGHLADLPAGDYFVQAVLSCNRDLRSPNAPGNLYSLSRRVHVDPAQDGTVKIELSAQVPPEQLPGESKLVKFVKIQSRLLSEFHGRPIYLRAGVILPRDYRPDVPRRYPLWVRIGGLDTRYTEVLKLMNRDNAFSQAWLAADAPQMVLLQLDGAGPYGDAYQINSANNGAYGDAVTQELIPFIEEKFHAGGPRARVLSGTSTGGWSSLALQVFYPDFFNGVWSCCPDGVDFRAFELVNIYEDENAYVNKFGFERPSERTLGGETRLTMRREVQLENALGRGGSWTTSGGQWCAWNATYGPRGVDGLPVPLWDPQTGGINHRVAAQWKKYDLRLVLQENWKLLGPKLRGKIHIAVGDADDYFLNNAVHLLDEFLSHADPPYEGRIIYGPGKGHGWSDVSVPAMMKEMAAATREEKAAK